MEVEILHVLELGLRRREHFLAQLHVVVHRAADVEQQEHLYRVAPLGAHVDVEVGLLRCRADGVLEVEFFRRALSREFSQAPQRNLDVARAELDRIVEVLVFALVPDLDRAAVARALLADADALGIEPVGPERGRAAGADPLVAALVALLLLLKALFQRLHELFPAAEGLDHFLFFVAQVEFGLLKQPLERDLRLDARNCLDPVPEFGESAVELVEIRLVLDQRDA